MKKRHFYICLAFGLATVWQGCGPKTGQGGNENDTDTLKTSVVQRYLEDSTGAYAINVAFPDVKTTDCVAMNEWVSEQLGGTYGDSANADYARLLADTTALVDYYFGKVLDSNRQDFAEIRKNNPDMEMEIKFLDSLTIRKFGEGIAWVTFSCNHEVYSGGAHGSSLFFGQTFRKSDGRRIGWDVFTNIVNDGFQQLLKAGLMEYWQLEDEAKLADYLMDAASIYYIPLPQCPPLFTEDGVCFVYNQYEIAAYAAGLPTFTVGYDKLRPFMMTVAKRLIAEK